MGLRSLDVLQQLPRLSDQRLNLFPLFDRAPRKQAMLERASVLFRRARPRRAAMHPTQLFPRAAGDRHGLPAGVLAPQRGLASIGPVFLLRPWRH